MSVVRLSRSRLNRLATGFGSSGTVLLCLYLNPDQISELGRGPIKGCGSRGHGRWRNDRAGGDEGETGEHKRVPQTLAKLGSLRDRLSVRLLVQDSLPSSPCQTLAFLASVKCLRIERASGRENGADLSV